MKLHEPQFRRQVIITCRLTKRELIRYTFPMSFDADKCLAAAWIRYKNRDAIPWRPRMLAILTVGVITS